MSKEKMHSKKGLNMKSERKGSSGNEGIVILAIIAVVVVAAIIIGTINDRSPVSGVKRSIYDIGMGAVGCLDSEMILDEIREGLTVTEEDPQYVALMAFDELSGERINDPENKKFTDNVNTFMDAIALSIQTQMSEAQIIMIQKEAENNAEIKKVEGFGDAQTVVDIYDKIWREGSDAVKTNDLAKMKEFMNESAQAHSEELKPYETTIANIGALIQEANSQASEAETMGNVPEDYDFDSLLNQ